MREIKFRFWGDFGTIENDDEEERKVMLYGDTWAYEEYEPIDDIFKSIQRNVIVMQYTGLKDENGKEIYEGDIISDGIKGLFLVEWNDDTCKFQFSDGTDINDGIRYGTSKLIMGNIYENPELKEVK